MPQRLRELSPRDDPELREDPIQMRADRPVRQVEALSDLPIGQAVCGQLRDLELLGRELIPRVGCATAARLAGRAQFLAGSFGKSVERQGVEGVPCRTERSARLGDPALTAQPAA